MKDIVRNGVSYRCFERQVQFHSGFVLYEAYFMMIQSMSESVKRTMSPALSPKLAATAKIAVSRSDKDGFFAAASMTV